MDDADHDSSSNGTSDPDGSSTVGSSSPKLQRHRSPEAVTHPETAPPARVNASTPRTIEAPSPRHKPRRHQHGRHCDHHHKCSIDKHSTRPRKSTESIRKREKAQLQSVDAVDNSTDTERDVYPVLRGGLELVRRLLVVKEETQKLVLLLRDAEFNASPVALDRLLPPMTRIATVLYQADGGATLDRWRAVNRNSSPFSSSPSTVAFTAIQAAPGATEPGTSSAVRTLAQTIGGAGAASRSAIVMQGWVISTEWRGIWRHQHAEYACLCDDHTFYLFVTRQQCADHIFELNRSRDGHASDTSARILKSSAPRRTLNLSEGEWAVRRAETAGQRETQQENTKAVESRRQALAFFDQKSGDIWIILDVSSPREAEHGCAPFRRSLTTANYTRACVACTIT